MTLSEKYRPKSWDDVVYQNHVVPSLKLINEKKQMPNLLFVGPPGCGKTTCAYLLAKNRGHLSEFNASDERGIDVVREKIKHLALSTQEQIIFLDEADNLTADAQGALRRIMEGITNATFVLSVNREHKLIAAIKSRCAIFRFTRIPDELVRERIMKILQDEKIEPDGDVSDLKDGLNSLVKNARGDLRYALNTLDTVVTDDKKIKASAIKILEKPKNILSILQMAIDGSIDKSKQMFEDVIVQGTFSNDELLEEFYNAIDDVTTRDEVKAKLYIKLRDVDDTLGRGGSPLIQFIALLYLAFISPHLKGVMR
jgi:replication factor C small subunit